MVIDTLELNIIVNNKGTTSRINNTTNSLKNLYNVISSINSVGGIDGAINGGGTVATTGGSSRSGGTRRLRSSQGFGSFFSKIYRMYFALTMAKRLGQSLGNVVQKGVDYEETLNLWQVAMKGNVDQAKKFVSEIGKAYGISDEITMRYQATFKNMLSALGQINQEVAYGLSETLTQMALDYSSLYNTTVESAMVKFQSALAGQVRPIRSESGYDITENTLFQLYQDIGGTKTIRQLSQTEKRLLRILAIYNQMKDTAKGDLAKTIKSTANQMRVMSEQGKQFVTWLGVAANQLIQNSEILIKINGYLYAAAAVAKAYAFSMGYVEKNAVEDPFGDMEQSAQDANEEIGKLQGKLLGFDKFQVLSTAKAGDGADISAEITKVMTDMQSILSNAVNPAYEKSLEILKAWGLELDENGDIIGGLDTIIEKVKGIGKVISGIFISIGLIAKPWLVVSGAIEYCYWANENFKNSVNEFFAKNSSSINKFVASISDIGDTILLILPLLVEDVMPILSTIISFSSELTNYVRNIINFASPIISFLGEVLKLLAPILDIISFIWLAPTKLLPLGAKIIAKPLQAVMSIAEAILKIFQTIASVISNISTFKFSSIGKNVKDIWNKNNWRFAGKEVWDESLFDVENNRIDKPSIFYDSNLGSDFISSNYSKTNSSNNNNIEDAVTRGVIRGISATDNNQTNNSTEFYIDGQKVFEAVRGVAKRNGYDLVKV